MLELAGGDVFGEFGLETRCGGVENGVTADEDGVTTDVDDFTTDGDAATTDGDDVVTDGDDVATDVTVGKTVGVVVGQTGKSCSGVAGGKSGEAIAKDTRSGREASKISLIAKD